MTEITKTLSAEARKLSPAERIDLVDDILASLDEPDPKPHGRNFQMRLRGIFDAGCPHSRSQVGCASRTRRVRSLEAVKRIPGLCGRRFPEYAALLPGYGTARKGLRAAGVGAGCRQQQL